MNLRQSTPTKRIITSIILVYSGLILGWFVLRLIFFDSFWPLAIVNTTAVYCFVPLPLLFVAALLVRDKKSLAVLLVPLAAFLLLWGALLLPAFANPQTLTERTLKAMSFNVLYSNKETDALIESVRSAAPDVIGLQELSPESIDAFKSELSQEYPYHTFDDFAPKGVGLMSRYPITAVSKFSFPPQELAIHAIVDWDGQPLHMFVVHLSANNFFDNPLSMLPQLAQERYGYRENQITLLEEELTAVTDPIILMCDCNLTDSSEAYSRLDTLLDDSFWQAGQGLGHTLYPKDIPFRVQRIDYVWHSDEFIATDAFVGQHGQSDHYPTISTLTLKNPYPPKEAQE